MRRDFLIRKHLSREFRELRGQALRITVRQYSGRRRACANGLKQELAVMLKEQQDGQCDLSTVSKEEVRLTGNGGSDNVGPCRTV